jgi:predicted RecA/RadA family phage recombinase
MAKNPVYPGDHSLPLTAPYAVASGGAALIGAIVAVAVVDLASGAVGTFMLDGTYIFPKNTGTGTGGAQGAKAYWDNTAKKFTAVSTGNTLAGIFFKTCTDAATTCEVRLSGVPG